MSAGIIERSDGCVLLVHEPHASPESIWQFPSALNNSGESPEACMRRFALDRLGIRVDIRIGQPPFLARIDGQEVEVRYFHCFVAGEHAPRNPPPAAQWVAPSQFTHYQFDEKSTEVAKWLMNDESPMKT
jgi:hypothetical protein